jgi:glyoxylase-like metal-dependent hydrolase (beta-lactamase superfamily II)
MPPANLPHSKHFDLHRLAEGVYAAIHKDGGAAYCNAGIIDLGDRTLVVDAFDTALAARDLRGAAEDLFSRPVEVLLLTHTHNDHWIGAYVFDEETTMYASEVTRKETLEWGKTLLNDVQDPAEWDAWIKEIEEQIKTEKDECVRVGLEKSITRVRFFMDEMSAFRPRYSDQTFEKGITFHSSERRAEIRSYGAGHSSDDVVLLLPEDGIAFIGDIGFFHRQPYMGFCDLDRWRGQLKAFQDTPYHTLVPGHGPLGGEEEIALQLEYFEVMEGLIRQVVEKGGSFEDAKAVGLPEPFDGWLMGGMAGFEVNVRYLYKRFGGEVPEEE